MNETQRKAFDFAQETVKQLVTLATATLALTVTFQNDVASAASSATKTWLEVSWLCYLASILLGVFALGSMAGTLATAEEPSVYRGAIRWVVLLQMIAFIAGLVSTIVFGFKAL